jgi:hypothetical protein
MAKYKEPIVETLTPHVNNPKQKPNQYQRIVKIALILFSVKDNNTKLLWPVVRCYVINLPKISFFRFSDITKQVFQYHHIVVRKLSINGKNRCPDFVHSPIFFGTLGFLSHCFLLPSSQIKFNYQLLLHLCNQLYI